MKIVVENTMAKGLIFIITLLAFFVNNSAGQISPGELSRPHAQLEGMLNCTKCHVLGDKVSNEKCLECHKEIKSRIDQKKGYHASSDVSGKDCFKCHSDHHGRNFEIVRFDADRFNHQLTGYNLTGAHRELDCNACHNEDLITGYELKQKKNTYLGLKTECVACHKDVHQNTLPQNCAKCHNTDEFIPAALFDHKTTEFPLKGKHQEVDCKKCHEVTFTNDALFQHFADIPFKSCSNCHADPHNEQFGNKCSTCHTEESFHVFVGKSTFDHNTTDFPLAGKHRKVDCVSCHQINANVGAENAFQDYRGKEFHNCMTCHKDVHENKFGTDCRKCHTEESFQKIVNAEQFEHSLTGYPLEGKHLVVDCRKCHETKFTDPVEHNACMNCHTDFHEGQFIQEKDQPDCKDCHSVEGFAGSSFTIEKHNEGAFPLIGAHLATTCIQCHLKNDKWVFKNIGVSCFDCHADVHENALNEKYYPQKSCHQCHVPDGWDQVSFEHGLTGFELQGKHLQTSCVQCHKPDNINATERKIPFTGLNTRCSSCHENIHDRQFEVEGVTDCKRCHGFEKWKPSEFNHNTARFVLDGAHKNVACKECHKEEIMDGELVVQYRMEKFECATCHE